MQKHNARLTAVQPELARLQEEAKKAKATGDRQTQQLVAQAFSNLCAKHDVSPLKPVLLPLMSMPIFLGMFYGIGRLVAVPLPEMMEGGFGWVTDLTMPDPYYILPLCSMVFTNIVLRVSQPL